MDFAIENLKALAFNQTATQRDTHSRVKKSLTNRASSIRSRNYSEAAQPRRRRTRRSSSHPPPKTITTSVEQPYKAPKRPPPPCRLIPRFTPSRAQENQKQLRGQRPAGERSLITASRENENGTLSS